MSGNTSGYYYTLLNNGECWRVTFGQWVRDPSKDPPIPLSEIAFYDGFFLIATNGDAWRLYENEWTTIGAPPVGTPAGSSNWSQLKSSFGK